MKVDIIQLGEARRQLRAFFKKNGVEAVKLRRGAGNGAETKKNEAERVKIGMHGMGSGAEIETSGAETLKIKMIATLRLSWPLQPGISPWPRARRYRV